MELIGNVWTSGVADEPDFLRYWNQVTPENAGKWGNVEAVRDQMYWTDLDTVYRFARESRIPFRLHTLVWGQSQPDWIAALSAEEQREEVEEWFALLGERYPEVDMIDVVNEPFHGDPCYARALGGAGETRFDWVITAFTLARKSFPHADLGLNEFGILGTAATTSGYLRLVRLLQDRGLIDCIGLQGHGLENVADQDIANSLELLAEARLPIYITELDVGIPDDAAQLERMRELMTVFAGNRRVRGVTLWGYREDRIYKKSAWLLGADGRERPALTWLRSFAGRRR